MAMKWLVALLFFYFPCFQLSAQENDFRKDFIRRNHIKRIEVKFHLKPGPKMRRTEPEPRIYNFNKDGLMEEYISSDNVSDEHGDDITVVRHYKYDGQERISEIVEMSSIMTEIHYFSYPATNKRIEKVYSFDTSKHKVPQPKLQSTRTSELDSQGQEIRAIAVYGFLPNQQTDQEEFFYNEMGDLVKRTKDWRNHSYVNFSFDYNSHSLKTKQYGIMPDGKKMLMASYYYNSKNMLIEVDDLVTDRTAICKYYYY